MARAATGIIPANHFNHQPPITDLKLEIMFSLTAGSYRRDEDLQRFALVGNAMDRDILTNVLPAQKGPRTWIPIWRDAECKIIQAWHSVQAVARALERERTLSGPQVFAIANESIDRSAR